MRAVCSSCHLELGPVEPLSDERVTHGMCADCLVFHTAVIGDVRLSEELANHAKPVLVLTPSRRLVTCNRKAEAMLGRPLAELLGLKSGEFLECERSRTTDGCGAASLCDTCAIRQTIEHTVQTGTPHSGIKAVLHTDRDGRSVVRQIELSTEKAGHFVQVRVDRFE